jgi:hypothetical protein
MDRWRDRERLPNEFYAIVTVQPLYQAERFQVERFEHERVQHATSLEAARTHLKTLLAEVREQVRKSFQR